MKTEPLEEEEDMERERRHSESDAEDEAEEGPFVVRLRGLPWSCKADDVVEFLAAAEVQLPAGRDSVHLLPDRTGRPSGEALIEVAAAEDVARARRCDRNRMGPRYIEVFRSSPAELEALREGAAREGGGGGFVRLRGLPFSATVNEVMDFFGPELEVLGIVIPTDGRGKNRGESFVHFPSRHAAERARDKHQHQMGKRYIEIFASTEREYREAEARVLSMTAPDRRGPPPPRRAHAHPYGFRDRDRRHSPPRGGGGEACVVHMRGLPFKASVNDVCQFFAPLRPATVQLLREASGRPSGEAQVEFDSAGEAREAMARDRAYMDSRYIELSLGRR